MILESYTNPLNQNVIVSIAKEEIMPIEGSKVSKTIIFELPESLMIKITLSIFQIAIYFESFEIIDLFRGRKIEIDESIYIDILTNL